MAESVHAGHRERMRKRYLETGFEGFQPHEVLEMLLYHGIPRKNTNETAHQLIERFGSLHGVLTAQTAELLHEPGVTQNAADLLSMVRALCLYDTCERLNGSVLDTYPKSCDYFTEIYRCETQQRVRVAALDQNLHVVRCAAVAEGHPDSSHALARQIIAHMHREGCSIAVLAHNHPHGAATITAEDIAATRALHGILAHSGITMVDHIMVTEEHAVSLREYGVFIGLNIK